MSENDTSYGSYPNPSTLLSKHDIGVWALEFDDGEEGRMYADDIMLRLIGFEERLDPVQTFQRFLLGLDEEASARLDENLERMRRGDFSEAEYSWTHPDGTRHVIRCSGRRDLSYSPGLRCEGTHRDVTTLVYLNDKEKYRRRIINSYSSYYDAKDAHVIMVVNLNDGSYLVHRINPVISTAINMGTEIDYITFLSRFIDVFVEEGYKETIRSYGDMDFLKDYFRTSPIYRQQFLLKGPDGIAKWFRMSADRVTGDEIVISVVDRSRYIADNIFLKSISSKLLGGFILDVERDYVTVVTLTEPMDFLGGRNHLPIALASRLIIPHIDVQYREKWRDFISRDNLVDVFSHHRRADFNFKAFVNGEYTWLRASLYSIDDDMKNHPAVVLGIRKYSQEELEVASQYEKISRQNERLENDLKLINGITSQYVALELVDMKKGTTMVFKESDLSYNLDPVDFKEDFWTMMNKKFHVACHPEDMGRMVKCITPDSVTELLKGRWRHAERFRFRKTDGTYVWLDLIFMRFDKTCEEKLSKFAVALVDVDHEVRMEHDYAKALAEARISKEESRLKTQFVNNISHDIRTPLNAVIGYSQLLTLMGDSLSPEEKSEYNNYILSSGELLTMLVDDILSISDIEHNIFRIKYFTSNCNEICQKAVSCCMMKVPVGVKLYYTSEFPDDFTFRIDPKRVQQILINMISNACKATESGEIRLHCARGEAEDMIDISVTDTGRGVSDDMADKIFTRFVSADNHSDKGHGLGLDICRQIAERLGGSIKLDRSYKGGARFVLSLPIDLQ